MDNGNVPGSRSHRQLCAKLLHGAQFLREGSCVLLQQWLKGEEFLSDVGNSKTFTVKAGPLQPIPTEQGGAMPSHNMQVVDDSVTAIPHFHSHISHDRQWFSCVGNQTRMDFSNTPGNDHRCVDSAIKETAAPVSTSMGTSLPFNSSTVVIGQVERPPTVRMG